MGAWFPKDEGGGEFLTLSHWGKSICWKKTPRNVCPFPHAFMFSSSLMFWGAGHIFWSSILQRSSGFDQNVVVHSYHSLFHFFHAHGAFVLLAELWFCSELFSFCYHPHRRRGLVYNLFVGQMRSGYHSIIWEIVVICGFLSVVVQWSPLSQSEWKPVLLCWHCGLVCVHIFPWYELVWIGIRSD